MTDAYDDLLRDVYGDVPIPQVRLVDSNEFAGKAEDGCTYLSRQHIPRDPVEEAALVLHEVAHLLVPGGHTNAFWVVNRTLLHAYAGRVAAESHGVDQWLEDVSGDE